MDIKHKVGIKESLEKVFKESLNGRLAIREEIIMEERRFILAFKRGWI